MRRLDRRLDRLDRRLDRLDRRLDRRRREYLMQPRLSSPWPEQFILRRERLERLRERLRDLLRK